MLESVRYSTISDICVTDLFFYDENKKNDLVKFCRGYKISYLPDRDRNSCWELTDSDFKHIESIPANFSCSPTDLIFDNKTIEKFKQGNQDEVMFVVENNMIKGVVHIVDYNNPDIYVELYRMLLKFEQNLRKLLIENGYKNEDILEWFDMKGRKETTSNARKHFKHKVNYYNGDEEKKKRINANPFQTFLLSELLYFIIDFQLVEISEDDEEKIRELRNWIAHSKDVTTIRPNLEHPVYNIKGLKSFIDLVKSFFNSYDVLELNLEKYKRLNDLPTQ